MKKTTNPSLLLDLRCRAIVLDTRAEFAAKELGSRPAPDESMGLSLPFNSTILSALHESPKTRQISAWRLVAEHPRAWRLEMTMREAEKEMHAAQDLMEKAVAELGVCGRNWGMDSVIYGEARRKFDHARIIHALASNNLQKALEENPNPYVLTTKETRHMKKTTNQRRSVASVIKVIQDHLEREQDQLREAQERVQYRQAKVAALEYVLADADKEESETNGEEA